MQNIESRVVTEPQQITPLPPGGDIFSADEGSSTAMSKEEEARVRGIVERLKSDNSGYRRFVMQLGKLVPSEMRNRRTKADLVRTVFYLRPYIGDLYAEKEEALSQEEFAKLVAVTTREETLSENAIFWEILTQAGILQQISEDRYKVDASIGDTIERLYAQYAYSHNFL